MKVNNEPSGLYEKIYEGERKRRVEQAQKEAIRADAAHRTEVKGRRRTAFRVITTFLLIVVVISLMFALIYKLFFRISDLQVTGNERYDAETIFKVAGVENGDNLYSFSSRVVFVRMSRICPYIKSLDVERSVPDKIKFTVEEHTPEFICEIYGDQYILSEDLYVLGKTSSDDLGGLCRLRLPAVDSAVCGSVISFRDPLDAEQVSNTASALLDAQLHGRVVSVDLTDPYSLTMSCENKYLLVFGGYSDTALKLKVAAKVLEDDMFKNETKAKIDLTDTSQTTVTVDNTLIFD